jgi:hypothetical protein
MEVQQMRLKVFPWLGRAFVSLSCEGSGAGSVEDETRAVFDRFTQALSPFGFGLEQVVRTRMFTRDMDTWVAANLARRRVLDGPARSVSSSHVWPGRLDDRARVSIDLLALVPVPGDGPKVMKEYDPPTVVLRRLTQGGILFLSGVTDMTHATLDEQFPVIIQRITDTLADGGAGWKDVAKASFLLHHEESLPALQARFAAAIDAAIPQLDYTFVGSRQGKRLEIEVTARLP